MKIAFVSTMDSVPWGGSEILWHAACQHLAKQGHNISIAYPRWANLPKPLEGLRNDFGIEIFQSQSRLSIPQRIKNKLKSKIGFQINVDHERKWLRDFNPDILCISSGNATEGARWMTLAAEENISFVTIAQAHVEFLWPDDDSADSLIRLFQAAQKCFFVSHGNLNLLETQLGYEIANAEVISNHSSALWNANPAWPTYEDGLYRLACVGRLHPPSKGQDLIIDVIRQPQWQDRKIIISFYGEGPHKRSLQRLVNKYHLKDKIKFCGHVSDVAQVWRDNHALILPSRYEGLPLALVEALMCGRTAIVTDVAGNSEVLENGVTGFLAEAPSIACLNRTMEEAWTSRNKWFEMGQLAQMQIHQRLPEDPGAILADKLIALGDGAR
jgi:glycosyltransferase involved in cell wall biosynthesis